MVVSIHDSPSIHLTGQWNQFQLLIWYQASQLVPTAGSRGMLQNVAICPAMSQWRPLDPKKLGWCGAGDFQLGLEFHWKDILLNINNTPSTSSFGHAPITCLRMRIRVQWDVMGPFSHPDLSQKVLHQLVHWTTKTWLVLRDAWDKKMTWAVSSRSES